MSRRSQVPLPTVKFYLREGLLHPGERTRPNQAEYDESHVRRLRLLRALTDHGGVSIATARALVAQADDPDTELFTLIGRTAYALTRTADRSDAEQVADDADHEVEALVARHGWTVRDDNPARHTIARLVATLRGLGHDDLLALLDVYADAAQEIAAAEIAALARRDDVDSMLEAVVTWTILGDAIASAMRRLAHEAAAAAQLRDGARRGPGPQAPRPYGDR